jgi:hypothetical protein
MLNLSTTDRSERLLGNLALLAFALTALAIVGWPVAGLLIGEDVRGNLAYGLTVGAIFADVALLLSLGAVSDIQKSVRVGWIVLTFIALGLCIYIVNLNDPEAYKAADTVLLSVLGILAFPASLAGMAIIFFYSSLFLVDRPTSAMDLVAFWVILTAAGYVQWFVLIPMLARRIRERRLRGTARGG